MAPLRHRVAQLLLHWEMQGDAGAGQPPDAGSLPRLFGAEGGGRRRHPLRRRPRRRRLLHLCRHRWVAPPIIASMARASARWQGGQVGGAAHLARGRRAGGVRERRRPPLRRHHHLRLPLERRLFILCVAPPPLFIRIAPPLPMHAHFIILEGEPPRSPHADHPHRRRVRGQGGQDPLRDHPLL